MKLAIWKSLFHVEYGRAEHFANGMESNRNDVIFLFGLHRRSSPRRRWRWGFSVYTGERTGYGGESQGCVTREGGGLTLIHPDGYYFKNYRTRQRAVWIFNARRINGYV